MRVPGNPIAYMGTIVRACRPHHWVKNLLLFLPLVLAHSFQQLGPWFAAAIGFVAFSLAASATYLVNDVVDRLNDQAHATKRRRPVAAGHLSSRHALGWAALLVLAGLGLSALLGLSATGTVATYLILSYTYSRFLKRLVLVDALTLSLLHLLRIVAGSVITGIPLSSWLVAFAPLLFFSLALGKRVAELKALPFGKDRSEGRPYPRGASSFLIVLGVTSGLASSVVFALYLESQGATSLYPNTALLIPALLTFTLWIVMFWRATTRGEMNEDPVVWSFQNPTSILLAGAFVVFVVAASVMALSPATMG